MISPKTEQTHFDKWLYQHLSICQDGQVIINLEFPKYVMYIDNSNYNRNVFSLVSFNKFHLKFDNEKCQKGNKSISQCYNIVIPVLELPYSKF